MDKHPRVGIVILNWNGWKDTVECLESVFRNSYPNFSVIVCDNDSNDDSIKYIKEWAEGTLQVQGAAESTLNALSYPPVQKPIPWKEYGREQAENGGDRSSPESQLVLIRTGGNLGYAGGNNVGLRYTLVHEEFEYIWLLNNDTVIDTVALAEMVRQMECEPHAGMCGSTLFFYHEPHKVQALGGATYDKWFGKGDFIGKGISVAEAELVCDVAGKLEYIIGASMLVRKSYLVEVGLMCEDYFLYFEEIDWALRGKAHYGLTYSKKSVVYHKEGGSTRKGKVLGEIPDYFGARNRLIFTRKFYPYALPIIYVGLIVALLNRLRKGQVRRAKMILHLLLTGN